MSRSRRWRFEHAAPDHASIVERYTQHTGAAVDADALRLYRLRWDLTEIALYVTELCLPHADTADTREAWDGLQDYLDPARWTTARS